MDTNTDTTRPKSFKRQRYEVEEQLRENATDIKVTQRCPYTCVVISTRYGDTPVAALGFSKVQWPDEFKSGFGIDLATKKAYANAAKDIVRGFDRNVFAARVPSPGIEMKV